MAYAWPANLAKNDAGWVTSLIDWPGIAAVSDTAQGSVLAASQELSRAIRERLANKAKIPLQSEVKPGQVQIPADADASALLEKYVEDEEERRLKRVSEIERANREKRSVFLSEFRANIEPTERLGGVADEAAVAFASIGIKFCYILNGGALVAIPAILKFTETGTVSKDSVLTSVVFFVLGIFFAVATNYLAYDSVFRAGMGHRKEGNARATELSITHYPPEDPSIKQAQVKSVRKESEDLFTKASRRANIGLGIFGLSVLAFLAGVSIIIAGI